MMKQVRIPLEEISETVYKLVEGFCRWEEVLEKYPEFQS